MKAPVPLAAMDDVNYAGARQVPVYYTAIIPPGAPFRKSSWGRQ